jgi:hypothetical protein
MIWKSSAGMTLSTEIFGGLFCVQLNNEGDDRS